MAKLFMRYASMNAGKSTYLLQVAHNYKSIGNPALLLTSSIDNRYGVGSITSRIGLSEPAKLFTPETCFKALLEDVMVSCVLIDEAQFLTPEQVRQLHRWVHERDIPVMCFGIRTDFLGNPFPGSQALLSLADDIQEIVTVCGCGKRATMNVRTDAHGLRVEEGEQVLIGGNNRYRQVCAKCFYSED